MILTTSEAAERLSVSAHEVRRLIDAGQLRALIKNRVWLVEEASVDDLVRVQRSRGRALAPHTTWAALWEISGEKAQWLDVHTRSRLRKWLRSQDAASLAAACRNRADRYRLRALPAYRDRVLASDGVTRTGLSAVIDVGADIVVVGDDVAEVYCSDGAFALLREQFGLADSEAANLIARVPRWRNDAVLGRAVMPAAVVAVDLMDAADFRTRRAGRDLLTSLLSREGVSR